MGSPADSAECESVLGIHSYDDRTENFEAPDMVEARESV